MNLVDKLIEVTTDEVVEMLYVACAAKQAGFERDNIEVRLNEALCSAIESYLNEAASDPSLYGDWEWSYMREVITPALKATAFSGIRYSGFGPRSGTMRFQASPKTPEFARILREIGDERRGRGPRWPSSARRKGSL
jgi:histone H3/H4